MISRTILLPATLLLLSACDSKLSEENFDQIENGMPREDVIALLGKPTETSSLELAGVSGTSAVWDDGSKRITVQFINNKVRMKQYTSSENEPIEY